ncbi:MAG TPA: hypothetical protein DCS75_06985 [Gemmatimonadetes bacterium]|nr:hypothetical protein [Gemmatimonadota bacterium]HAT38221.1 hypothetical protein [Gemmatimonadota bacterium]HBV05231.1 hypothetical protein [Gemmatimonadota bacterium]HCO12941.1 hypothetical protein [Gemmatimonadota bacterium]
MEVRGIPVSDGDISCTVEGMNEVVDRIILLTKIHVHYTLRLPPEASEDRVSRALETHVSKCPTAQSIKDSVEISWSVEFVGG